MPMPRRKNAKNRPQPVRILQSLDDLKSAATVSLDEIADLTPKRADDVGRALLERRARDCATRDAIHRNSLLGPVRTRAIDEGAMTVEVWASDQRVDRHGDIVMQNWEFDNFAANPLILFNHDWDGLPMAQALNWSVKKRSEDGYDGPALKMTLQFKSEDETNWEWGERVFRLISAGLLNATSVGFYPGEVIWVQDSEERAEYGLGPYGYIYDKNELIELSVVTVPSNVGASIIRSARDSGLESGDLQLFRELRRRELRGEDAPFSRFMESDLVVREIWKTLFGERPAAHKAYDEPLELGGVEIDNSRTKIGEGSDDSAGQVVLDRLDEITDALDGITETLSKMALTPEASTKGSEGENDYVSDLLKGLAEQAEDEPKDEPVGADA